MPLVKICGTTNIEDARLAQAAGADFFGIIVEHPPSPRSVPLDQAIAIAGAIPLPVAAVTVNLPLERLIEIYKALTAVNADVRLQLHGDESPELVARLKAQGIPVWTAISGNAETVRQRAAAMREAGVDALLLDAREQTAEGIIYGGTGKVADWAVARQIVESGTRVILAGGLDPDNVRRAMEFVRPWAVDAVSSVEAQKGRKDPEKVRAFIQAAK
jgi:phosphoribosylanthranilate isomerase